MKVVADVSLLPMGVGPSVSKYIAACERVLAEAGLRPSIHAEGTEVEGEWETVLDAVRRCHQEVHEMGVPRIDTVIKLNTRTDREESAARMIRSVREKL